MKRAIGFPLAMFVVMGCGSKDDARTSAASASGSSASMSTSPQKSAKPMASGAASASPSASSSANGAGVETLGGSDWKAPFVGESPLKLETMLGGGTGDAMADDHTHESPNAERAKSPWKFNAAGGGGVNWSPTKKAVLVTNVNIKMNPDNKAIELWSKSALIKDLKLTAGPEVIEVGPTKALVLAGAGTCAMKDGGAADLYWYDANAVGDTTHDLSILIVAKDAPTEEKEVALTLLRGFFYTPKAKSLYKK